MSNANPGAAAAAVAQLPAGLDGWVEFSVSALSSTAKREVGFQNQNTTFGPNYINYGWFLQSGAYIMEDYYQRGSAYTVVPGDKLRVERVGSTVTYKINGTAVYTSTVASTTALWPGNYLVGINMLLPNIRTSIATVSQTTTRTFDYDQVGRLLHTWHSMNGATPVLLAADQYNEIGQAVTKQLYSTDGSTFKQKCRPAL